MTEPARAASAERSSDAPRDDEYARAYADGYGEGLRDALRDLLSHLSRGHTPHEVRMIVESRLARVREEVELKRKSLLAPPRRPSWGALLRPPTPGSDPPAPAAAESIGAGRSVLFLEARPGGAISCAEASAAGFAQLLVLSFHPPTFRGVPAARVEFVPVRPADGSGGADPTRLSGRIVEALGREGGTLVYLDAIEVLSSEAGADRTSKFVTWLASEVAKGSSALIASSDPAALDAKDRVLYQRAFNVVR